MGTDSISRRSSGLVVGVCSVCQAMGPKEHHLRQENDAEYKGPQESQRYIT